MNNLLQLKGQFQNRPGAGGGGASKLPKGSKVEVQHLHKLKNNLESVYAFWQEDKILEEALVSVYYSKVAAKSNRLKGLLTRNSIVGARFTGEDTKKHVITHCVSMEILTRSIDKLGKCIRIVDEFFGGCIRTEDVDDINSQKKSIDEKIIKVSSFVNVIVDAYYVEKFDVDREPENISDSAIITIYKTRTSTEELMEKLGIDLLKSRRMDDTTLLLLPEQYEKLKSQAPYLISMGVSNMAELSKEDFPFLEGKTYTIPEPKNEPTVGVIDTLFDETVYFANWVDYHDFVTGDIEKNEKDFEHGTLVTSIIVDGPTFNPELDDECGRFKVRHFGVATSAPFSSFGILRSIKDIVIQNKDIKVWNLSLGAAMEIKMNSISPEAAILDQIQYENDVIFVIAGTNGNGKNSKREKIGAPADSINAIVVNAVNFQKRPASYSREGLVLSFFNKPDVSYYGGDTDRRIRACDAKGTSMVMGTSYAAPWISRKMAYMIYVLGLSREVAKALLIDSTTGWHIKEDPSNVLGYGVVPIKISDVIQSPNDEIRFVLSDVSQAFDTYNFNIPVPIYKEKQPFIAKATLCYFPKCTRNQGVDYTNTEMDLHFGRVKDTSIKTVNNNTQSTEGGHYLYEKDARSYFRKWDNVKHIVELPKSRLTPKKVYENGMWGISLKTKERLDSKDGVGLKFGVVVTLKEINGVNRIEEFIQQCFFRGWLVNRIDVEVQTEVYNKAEEEVTFE